MNLHELAPAKGSRKRRKRIGRGPGSGHGKTAGKGHKGLFSQSGGKADRLAVRGRPDVFDSARAEAWIYEHISQGILDRQSQEPREMTVSGTITPQALVDAGLVKRKSLPIKILGNGISRRPLLSRPISLASPQRQRFKQPEGESSHPRC